MRIGAPLASERREARGEGETGRGGEGERGRRGEGRRGARKGERGEGRRRGPTHLGSVTSVEMPPEVARSGETQAV